MGLEILADEKKIRGLTFNAIFRQLESIKETGITSLVSCRKDLRADGERVVRSCRALQLSLKVTYSIFASRLGWARPDRPPTLIEARVALRRLNPTDHIGETELSRGAERGLKERVQACLENGGDTEANGGVLKRTPLIQAACCGHKVTACDHEAVVELLIASGAKVNARDQRHDTALICAAWGGRVGIVRQLHGARADLNAQGMHADTALIRAARLGEAAVVKVLLELRADPTVINQFNETAFLVARNANVPQTALGRQAVMELLTDWGKSVVS
jgi:hypothetical protein